jgi:aspartate/methionine/tyrosine aminotransferase
MNPLLSTLQPYPFERLKKLFEGVTPNPAYRPISLGIGEPKHATPALVIEAMHASATAQPSGFAGYPATGGEPALRTACANWMQRRYGVTVNAATQVLPVNGSREALFAFAQTVIDPTRPGVQGGTGPMVVSPNPFYQIYEGAALLAGATPYFAPSDPARNFAVAWDTVPDSVWANTQLLFVCSPGNPTGAVMPLDEWQMLFELSDRHGFVIASDECYSEIYFRDDAPLGGLEAAVKLGRTDFKNLVMFTSLSKRSNVPGMRSGFVAGDAALAESLFAVPHLPRQCHEPGGAGRQRGRLERRGPCGGQPRPIPNQVCAGDPGAGQRAGRGLARCQLLPLGGSARRLGRQRHGLRPGIAGSIQCDGAARQLPGTRCTRLQPRCWPHPHGTGGRNRRMPGSRPTHC